MKYFIASILIIILTSCGESKNQPITRSLPPKIETKQTPLESSMSRGKEVYNDNCISCHMTSGKGVAGAFPPLNPSNWLIDKRKESIHAIKYGLKGNIEVNGVPYNNVMLPLGLDDQEIADVMNYTIQTWNSGEIVTVEDVKTVTK